MASVIGGFFILVLIATLTVPLEQPSKYEGLSQDQINRVKIFAERCEAQAYLAGAGSDTATEQAQKRCNEAEATLIERYRNETAS